MQNLDELLAQIDVSKTLEEQKEILNKFPSFSEKDINDLLTKFYQEEAGIVLKYIGFPQLKKHLPDLINILHDLNRPLAWHASELIVNNPEITIEAIKKTLREHDAALKTNLILIINNWDRDHLFKIKEDLINAASGWFDDRLDALRLLIDKEIINQDELQNMLINNEAILSTSIAIIEDEYNWKNLDYLINNILIIKEQIGRKLNSYLLINLEGIAFYSNESFQKSKNLFNRFIVKLDKKNLDKDNILELSKLWGYETTINLGNENINAIKLLANKEITSKNELKAVISNSRNGYNRIIDICNSYIKELNLIEEQNINNNN